MSPGFRDFYHRYRALFFIVKIGLSLALFAYVVAKVSPGNVWAVVRRADPDYLGAAAALFVVSNFIGSWLWGRLLRAQGVRISYSRAAAYYFVGLFFNNFLPSNIGGDIARISDASKHAPSVSPVFSATLMDRLLGVVAILLLAVIASVAALDHVKLYAIYGGIVIVFLLSLGLFFSIFHRGVLKAFEWPFRVLHLSKVEEAIGRILDDLHGFRNERAALRAAFLASTLVQVSRIYVHYLVGVSLGVRLAAGYYFLFVPVLAALVSLPISMNGLGIREGASVVLFQMAGLTREQAFTIPFVTYLMSVVISLLGGFIFVTRSPRRALARKLEARREKRSAGRDAHSREDSR